MKSFASFVLPLLVAVCLVGCAQQNEPVAQTVDEVAADEATAGSAPAQADGNGVSDEADTEGLVPAADAPDVAARVLTDVVEAEAQRDEAETAANGAAPAADLSDPPQAAVPPSAGAGLLLTILLDPLNAAFQSTLEEMQSTLSGLQGATGALSRRSDAAQVGTTSDDDE